ncbi:MAG: hypothetical protein KDJ37_11410 [Hyphomicrobiaceae bacterium]|nr:hypothetical protein [Hyphomicrobiaceae bacterium]
MEQIHPVATDHLPAFVTAPGSTDILMVVSAVVLIVSVLAAGVFFLWLHSLPERMVHNKLQYDLVAVLALISLLTHVHAFWIAALLLAFITIPDLSKFDLLGPLRSIAKSLRSIADRNEASLAIPSPKPAASSGAQASGDKPVAKEH